jgi:hypothetical protein
VVFDIFAIYGHSGDQLTVKEDRKDDVEDVLPYFKVSHQRHFLYLHLQHLFVGVEGYRKAFLFPSLMLRHKSVPLETRSVYVRVSTVADPQQLFQTPMLLGTQFEFEQFRLTSEVVLVDMLVVVCTRIDIKEFLARHLVMIEGMDGNAHIVDSHISHLDLVLVVDSRKVIVQGTHLSPEVTATERCIDYLALLVDAPASLVRDRRDIFEEVEHELSEHETKLELLLECDVLVPFLGDYLAHPLELLLGLNVELLSRLLELRFGRYACVEVNRLRVGFCVLVNTHHHGREHSQSVRFVNFFFTIAAAHGEVNRLPRHSQSVDRNETKLNHHTFEDLLELLQLDDEAGDDFELDGVHRCFNASDLALNV